MLELTLTNTIAGLAASACTGLVVSWMAWTLFRILGEPRRDPVGRYQMERRTSMRRVSPVYRWFEPLIEELTKLVGRKKRPLDDTLNRALLSSTGRWKHWRADEFLATKVVEGLLAGGAVFVLVACTGFVGMAALLAVGLAASYPALAQRSLVAESERRLKSQRLRLPFVVDQIALMMQAGAGFEECLRSIVADDPRHPLAEELAMVLADCDVGRTRRDALQELKGRLPDRDIGELVFAITKGEELGTPLSAILSDQAEQMRLKRSQWGEKAAAEAEVQIVFPGMLVMIACLIVVVAPILLPAAFNVFDNAN